MRVQKQAKFPSPKDWQKLLPYMSAQELAELDALLLARAPWEAFPGPQTRALRSNADITGFGGAAGGGKSGWLLGTAHLRHWKSIIYRREYAQLEDLIAQGLNFFAGIATWRGAPRYRWWFEDGRER